MPAATHNGARGAGRPSPGERIERLCDTGSIAIIRSAVQPRGAPADARGGDGVVAASATIDGRPVLCYAQDSTFAGGSLGEAHAETIVRVLTLAAKAQVPVIGLIQSAGARIQEATAALNGYARVFSRIVALSKSVPQISIVDGMSAGGGAYTPALTDFVVMTGGASMFLTGPGVVRAALGEEVNASELGGASVHARNGVSHFVAPDERGAAMIVRELLSYLPQNSSLTPPERAPEEPIAVDPANCIPPETCRVYDVREVARAIVDGGKLLEVSPSWARNMVTAFARIDGRAVGVVANQPLYKGGVIDVDASQKGASFVRICDAFSLPLIVLVDTPGFLPGTVQERQGIIRHGADLLRAFASAKVPRLTVILRQAYGGAYITMNARDLGADLVFAWPAARIGVIAAREAVDIIHRREIADAGDSEAHRLALAEQYTAEHQSASAIAQAGFVDEVIAPAHTRQRLSMALMLLAGEHGRGE